MVQSGTISLSAPTSPSGDTFVAFALPDIGDAEVTAATRVLRSGWITTGPEVHAFEEEFARMLGVDFAVAVNSCTAALHLGLEALGIGRGDDVITSTMTFTATAEVAEYLGAHSRFVDVDPTTLNLSVDDIRRVIEEEYVETGGERRHRSTGRRLRAIVPVHYAGHPCDMAALTALAREYSLVLLDDAAHALPAAIDGRRIGDWDCPTAFSFYATKTLTTGEGGMLTTNDPAVAERARLMALHGISRDAWKRYTAEGSWYYEVLEPGYKYNLTDIAAAIGRVQLQRAASMRARREAIANTYRAALRDNPAVDLLIERQGVEHAWHLFPIMLVLDALTIDRGAAIEELRRRGIGTSVHFIPLHRQPFYMRKYGYDPRHFPVAEAAYPRLISLPIYSKMNDAQVGRVLDAVHDVTARFRR